ncbi:hypothetical protein APHAL10511_002774 [Amanita phalloides]|nr:hypothetical protein APHAL10511_002774 [Amanita phalloides]
MIPQRPEPAKAQPGAAVITVDAQPQTTVEMNTMNAPSGNLQCAHERNRTSRIRGGGAAKDCCMTVIGAFLCFESCKACCECITDVICCPCEICC